MAAAAKYQEFRGPRLGDAASLWNFAPAPGWTNEEVAILKLCLMKYGVGSWQSIQSTGLLPGKLVQQLVGQTQRLLGQQSLCAFTGLQVDIDRVRADNDARTDVQRKAGLIINSGRTATAEDKEVWRREMNDKYGLSASRLREVASQLEDMSAQRIDQVGGEGLQGAVARAGLHDVLECDASQLPPALAAQLLRRLRTKLGVLVDRLRSSLSLPPVGRRAWEEPCPQAQDLGSDLEALPDGTTEDLSGHEGAQPAAESNPQPTRAADPPPIRRPRRPKGRRGGGAEAAGRDRTREPRKKACLLRAAQGDAAKGTAASKRKRQRANSSSEDGDSSDAEPPSRTVHTAPAMVGHGPSVGGGFGEIEPAPEPQQQQQPTRRKSHRSKAQATWGTILEDDIASLQAMGFSRARAREALEEHPGSVEEALEWLLSGGAD